MTEQRGIVRTREGVPVAGVTLSDGRGVTKTDEGGRFALRGAGPYIFLTRPAAASCEQWYMAPRAGGELEFTLDLAEQRDPRFRFAHITDLHLSVGGRQLTDPDDDALFRFVDGEMLRRDVAPPHAAGPLLEALTDASVDFVIATGDVTNRGRPEEYEAYLEFVRSVPRPVYTVPGNHDLMPQPGDQPVTGGNQQIDQAAYGVVTGRYERYLGPRWYSFGRGEVHFVVLDWYTLYLGIDTDEQLQWLAADLAATPDGQPWVLLAHDQLESDLVTRLPRPPMAVISGHRHTSRVVRDATTLWISTGSAIFGGLDHSPPQFRTLSWNGGDLELGTVWVPRLHGRAIVDTSGGLENWTTSVHGRVHRAAPVTGPDGAVFVVTENEATASALLSSIDADTGQVRWQRKLETPGKSTPLVIDDIVAVTLVTGQTAAFDATSGNPLWENGPEVGADLWAFAPPVSDGSYIFVIEPTWVGAFRLSDGSLAWQRTDLGARSPMTTLARPAIKDGALILGFLAHLPAIWKLDTRTGDTLWPANERGRLAFERREELVQGLPLSLASSLSAAPDGDLYGRRLGETLFRLDPATGEHRWEVPLAGWFDADAPVTADDRVLAVSQGRILVSVDRETGTRRWATDLTVEGPFAMRPYARRGSSLTAAPVVVGDTAVVGRADGSLAAVGLEDGELRTVVRDGAPITAAPTVCGGRLVTVDVYGNVQGWDPSRLGISRPPEAVR